MLLLSLLLVHTPCFWLVVYQGRSTWYSTKVVVVQDPSSSVRRPFGAPLVVPKLLAHPFFFVYTHNQPYSTWDIGFPSV